MGSAKKWTKHTFFGLRLLSTWFPPGIRGIYPLISVSSCLVYCTSFLFSHLSRVRLFCDPTDCSPPSSSVHGIFQTRTLEWVAISFSVCTSWAPVNACLNDYTWLSIVPMERKGFFFFLFHSVSLVWTGSILLPRHNPFFFFPGDFSKTASSPIKKLFFSC